MAKSTWTLPRGVRTYGPSDVEDQFYMHKKEDEILAVRAKIERVYSSLLPNCHEGLLEVGFCFGLLHPRCNINANVAISYARGEQSPLAGGEGGREPSPPAGGGGGREPSPPAGGGGREEHTPPRARGVKRSREPLPPAEGVEAKVAEMIGDAVKVALMVGVEAKVAEMVGAEAKVAEMVGVEAKVAEMVQRSLDGLTAFLTCLFPYLPDAEAWKYLDAADADPLVASLLIIKRRYMEFDCSSQMTKAIEVALRCAAVAAKHPDPHSFVAGWKLLSNSNLAQFVQAVTFAVQKTPKAMQGTVIFPAEKTTPDPVLRMDEWWECAKRRFGRADPENQASPEVLPPTRAHKKRMLLAKIHGFYVEALGRLPKAELRSCYHQSMLMGGYCYGPLDPVSNIILSTIWYEQRFPSSKQFEVSMISTQLLWRIVARSLYGLISFLCTRHQGITPDQAIESLLVTNVNLSAALYNLATCSTSTSSLFDDSSALPLPASVADAFVAAGAAAFHCSPFAHSEFLTSQIGDVFELFPQHYKDGYPLSSEDISSICRVLESCSSSSGTHQQQDIAPTKVKKRVYADLCQCSTSFWGQHDRVTGMVKDALDKFNESAKDGRVFELHIIFGVNEFVSGPVLSLDGKVGKYNPWSDDKYFHSHLNFLAVCKDSSPTLFFAECAKDGPSDFWCVPVSVQKSESEKPRCIYCEHEANRIIHPATEGGYHGRDDFVELFYLSDREFYNNDEIIEYNGIYVDWVHDVSDGAIYLNSYPDEDDDGGDEADWIDIY